MVSSVWSISRRSRRLTRRQLILRYVIVALLALFIVGAGAVVGFVAAAVRGLPALANLEPNPALTSFIYDVNGQLVTDVAGWENRVPVKLSDVPQSLIDAFVASEDARFWTHHGVDFRGILRALYRDLTHASIQEGASTITQQFARNAFGLGYEKTVTRKVQEIVLAIQIERRYTKQEILEMYMNQIYFGHSAYGVQAAAHLYFNKDVSQLKLPEAALIAGVAQNANIYSPYVDRQRALARRNTVLDQMARYGKITAAQTEEAKKTPLDTTGLPPENYPAAYFVDYVLEYLLDRYGADMVYRGGLKIYTTIDMSLQAGLEKSYADILDKAMPLVDAKTGKPTDAPQSAAVFLDPDTGAIRAMVGGRKHEKRLELNRAVAPRGTWEGTLRQPGSAFKPIVDYAPAIELGWSPASILDDSVKTWNLPGQPPYSPENYNKMYRGLTTLREGLQYSINTMAIKLLDAIGPETGVRYAKKLGIDTLVTEGAHNDVTLATAIGGLTQGVSVLDMARAYAVFDNGGIRVDPYAVIKVEDKYGNVLEQNEPHREVALSEQAAYIVTSMLQDVVLRGTGAGAYFGRPAAGKTGTTDENQDVWYIGYTPEIVGAFWMGYDQPKEMKEVFGATYCAPMWKETVSTWLKDRPVQNWKEPSGIVRVTVCTESGQLPGPNCPPSSLRDEIFIEGRQPMTTCTVHVSAVVCADKPWMLATPECPQTITRTFIRRPEPFEVFKKVDDKIERLMTYVPEDAADEYPTEYCDMHGTTPPVYAEPTQTVNMTAVRYAFDPKVIHVPVGTRVILKIKALDTNHGFALPDYGIDEIVLRGREKTITFVADKPGTFMFYSSVYSGKGVKDMTGELVVGQ